MSSNVSVRQKTGERCSVSGIWQFDGYTDGTSLPAPTAAERQIAVSVPNTLPPVRSCNKACWWRLVQRS